MKSNVELFKGKRVLIVGDICLDHYVVGTVSGKAQEADVPIVKVKEEFYRLGMAANVAANVKALGGEPVLIQLYNNSDLWQKYQHQLNVMSIDHTSIYEQTARKMTVKTRVFDKETQISRMDIEDTFPIDADTEEWILDEVAFSMSFCDVVVLQDYAKGMLTENVIQHILRLAKKYDKKVIIDPHVSSNPNIYRGAYMITPNLDELKKMTKIDESDTFGFSRGMIHLRHDHQIENVITTVGKNGIYISNRDKIVPVKTEEMNPVDVTGAGDTVVSVLALGEASGLPIEESCRIANLAAGIAISKFGTSVCSLEELLKIHKPE